jgi:hypothetical protein
MGSLLLTTGRFALVLQVLTASVVGTVRDGETGSPLAGVLVVLSDLDRYSITDSLGGYVFHDLPPGPQHLRIERMGYGPRTLHAFVPRSGELRIDVALGLAPIPVRGLEVRSTVALRGLEPDDPGDHREREMTMAAVRNHPLLAEADVLQALSGGEVTLRPESPSGLHIRGGASDQTAYLLDGIPVLSPYHVAGLFSAWNPDALSSLHLASSYTSPGLPDALSGTVVAATRSPGPTLRAQGGLSNSHLRLTVDGPTGEGESGYVLSLRRGFPGGVSKPGEASYLRGASGDVLGKAEAEAFGGQVKVLGYGSWNGIDAAARVAGPDSIPSIPGRNAFDWGSRSVGGGWVREGDRATFRARVWVATGTADASWRGMEERPTTLTARRQDLALVLEDERGRWGGQTVAGIRLQEIRTDYRVTNGEEPEDPLRMNARIHIVSPYLQESLQLSRHVSADWGISLPLAEGRARISPRVRMRWNPLPSITLSGSFSRLHQFAQSLRNSESVVGNVFPVDLFMASEAGGIPVARSDQGVVAAEVKPAPGFSLGGQAYVKSFHRLLLVAPVNGGPFSTGSSAIGSGHSYGASVEGSLGGPRYGVIASYGWQRLTLEYEGAGFRPEWGVAHTFEGGVIAFPSTNTSARLGFTGIGGRRTTAVDGALEWESCNLLDRGCEFGGSPRLSEGPLGTVRLPSYLRLDLGFQKHWHRRVANRDILISLYGTFTNLLSRKNLLTLATDPLSGERVGVEMRPLSPLVLGLDWRF